MQKKKKKYFFLVQDNYNKEKIKEGIHYFKYFSRKGFLEGRFILFILKLLVY
jgi:hypothetical protein